MEKFPIYEFGNSRPIAYVQAVSDTADTYNQTSIQRAILEWRSMYPRTYPLTWELADYRDI